MKQKNCDIDFYFGKWFYNKNNPYPKDIHYKLGSRYKIRKIPKENLYSVPRNFLFINRSLLNKIRIMLPINGCLVFFCPEDLLLKYKTKSFSCDCCKRNGWEKGVYFICG